MFELNQITDRTYYIQSPAKIGLVLLDGGEVVLRQTDGLGVLLGPVFDVHGDVINKF